MILFVLPRSKNTILVTANHQVFQESEIAMHLLKINIL